MYIIRTISSHPRYFLKNSIGPTRRRFRHIRLTSCAALRILTALLRRRRMTLQALGYVGFGSVDLDDWRRFGTGLVGLQAVERSSSLLAFRMDDRKQRIVIDRSLPEGERFFGWEVADADALDALAAHLERAQVDVTAEPQTLADNRHVRGLISFKDP